MIGAVSVALLVFVVFLVAIPERDLPDHQRLLYALAAAGVALIASYALTLTS